MVSVSMTMSDPWPGFQGHGSFKRQISPMRRILQTQLLYRTLIGNHRQAIDRRKLAIQLTIPLLLHKPCKRFASVAQVRQRQLAFLVYLKLLNFTVAWMLSYIVCGTGSYWSTWHHKHQCTMTSCFFGYAHRQNSWYSARYTLHHRR